MGRICLKNFVAHHRPNCGIVLLVAAWVTFFAFMSYLFLIHRFYTFDAYYSSVDSLGTISLWQVFPNITIPHFEFNFFHSNISSKKNTARWHHPSYKLIEKNWTDIQFHLKDKKTCFVGFVRNSHRRIVYLLNQIDWIAQNIFDQTCLIIIESNSHDNTSILIHNWMQQHKEKYGGNNDRLRVDLINYDIVYGVLEKYATILDKSIFPIPNEFFNLSDDDNNNNMDNLTKNQMRYNYKWTQIVDKIQEKRRKASMQRDKSIKIHNNIIYDDFNLPISRISRFVIYRNFLLQYLKAHVIYNKIDYLMLIDLDGAYMHVQLILTQLINGIQYRNYSGICVNGYNPKNMNRTYRDTYALVTSLNPWFHTRYRRAAYKLTHDPNRPFVNVISCFGGMAIYDFQKIITNVIGNQCKYFYYQFKPSNDPTKNISQWKFSQTSLKIEKQWKIINSMYKELKIYQFGKNKNNNNNDFNHITLFNKSIYNLQFDNNYIHSINSRNSTQANLYGPQPTNVGEGMLRDMFNWQTKDKSLTDYTDTYYRPFVSCEHISFHYCLTKLAGLRLVVARDALYALNEWGRPPAFYDSLDLPINLSRNN